VRPPTATASGNLASCCKDSDCPKNCESADSTSFVAATERGQRPNRGTRVQVNQLMSSYLEILIYKKDNSRLQLVPRLIVVFFVRRRHAVSESLGCTCYSFGGCCRFLNAVSGSALSCDGKNQNGARFSNAVSTSARSFLLQLVLLACEAVVVFFVRAREHGLTASAFAGGKKIQSLKLLF